MEETAMVQYNPMLKFGNIAINTIFQRNGPASLTSTVGTELPGNTCYQQQAEEDFSDYTFPLVMDRHIKDVRNELIDVCQN